METVGQVVPDAGDTLVFDGFSEPIRLGLKVRPSSRIAAFIATLFVPFVAAMIFGLLVAFPLGALNPLLGSLVALAGIVLTLAVLRAGYHTFREAIYRPALLIDDASLTIHDPSVFRRAIVIPLSQLRAIAIDTPEERGLWDASDLPVEVEHEQGFLSWQGGHEEALEATNALTRFYVPLLGRDPLLTPNAAIVLHEPLDVGGAKRRSFRLGGFLKTVEGTKTTQGFSARVKDVRQAHEVFASLRLLRKLNSSDAAILEPRPEDEKRINRAQVMRAMTTAYFILAAAQIVWDLIRS